MGRRMIGVTRRQDSGVDQFNRRVPTDVQGYFRGRPFLFPFPDNPKEAFEVTISDRIRGSLRTNDPQLAAARTAALLSALEAAFAAARNPRPQRLSASRINELAGWVYAYYVNLYGDDPGPKRQYELVKAAGRMAREGRGNRILPLRLSDNLTDGIPDDLREASDLTGTVNAEAPDEGLVPVALEVRYGDLVEAVLSVNGHANIDPESRSDLIEQIDLAVERAARQLKRHAGFDFTPDQEAVRYRPISPVVASSPRTREPASVTLGNLVDRWAVSRSRLREKTIAAYRRTVVDDFGGFLRDRTGHVDPTRMTKRDVVAYRDALVAKGVTAKTINDNRLAALGAVFSKAHRDDVLAFNPAAGIDRVEDGKESKRRGYEEGEAFKVLVAAREYRSDRAHAKTVAAFRFAPAMCAFTGMRVSEALQARKKDFVLDDMGWWLYVTPEAGSTKNDEARYVPLRSELMQGLGLAALVTSASDGPLFYDPPPGFEVDRDRVGFLGGRLASWIRKSVGIEDTMLDPNHAWRHRFVTLCRANRINKEVRDYVVAQNTGDVSHRYGDRSAGVFREVKKLPVSSLYPVPSALGVITT